MANEKRERSATGDVAAYAGASLVSANTAGRMKRGAGRKVLSVVEPLGDSGFSASDKKKIRRILDIMNLSDVAVETAVPGVNKIPDSYMRPGRPNTIHMESKSMPIFLHEAGHATYQNLSKAMKTVVGLSDAVKLVRTPLIAATALAPYYDSEILDKVREHAPVIAIAPGVAVLGEEMRAWHQAKKYAPEVDVTIDQIRKVRNPALASYVFGAAGLPLMLALFKHFQGNVEKTASDPILSVLRSQGNLRKQQPFRAATAKSVLSQKSPPRTAAGSIQPKLPSKSAYYKDVLTKMQDPSKGIPNAMR